MIPDCVDGLGMPSDVKRQSSGKVALWIVGGIFFGIGILGAGLGGGPIPLVPYAIWIVGLICLGFASGTLPPN